MNVAELTTAGGVSVLETQTMSGSYTTLTYCLYIAISVAVTVWVGQTLYKNGAGFLLEVFKGDLVLAKQLNHLLVVGFYLLNLGYVTLALKINDRPTDIPEVIESLSFKVGAVAILMGLVHFANIYALNRIRSNVVASNGQD